MSRRNVCVVTGTRADYGALDRSYSPSAASGAFASRSV